MMADMACSHVPLAALPRSRYVRWKYEDTSKPIESLVAPLHSETREAWEAATLASIESIGRRIHIRLQPELLIYNGHKWEYKRMIGRGTLLTLPNADQTHALLAMLRDILSQLDGRMLDTGAGRPSSPDPASSQAPPPPSSGSESRPGGTSDDASSPQNYPPK